MKKYTILGHVFELDSHAHAFLTRYIERIDETAKSQHISRDVLEDIKYSVIEKLYSYPTPITEAQVMNLAEAIGDPEDIFDTKNNETTDITDEASRLQRRFGKDKPMVRGVCYWISKSLNISVGLVRLIALVSIFIYGISIWMYPLLALFVPYKDKKSTSGSVGNLFFEFIRVIFWLGIIFALFGTLMTSITVTIGLLFAPLLSNQSLIALVPSYMYPVGIVSMIGLSILLVGSIGALLKKSWVSKTMALIAIAITIIGTITGISTIYQKGVSFVQNDPIVISQSLTGTNNPEQPLTIHIVGGKMDQKGLNNDIYKMTQSIDNEINEMTQSIDIIESKDTTISAQIETTMKIVNESDKEIITTSLNNVDLSYSGSVLNIILPNKLFNQKVPFSLIERKIIISVPKTQRIILNNDSSLKYYIPYSREETRDGKEYTISCTTQDILKYYPETSSWRCTETTAELINNDTQYTDQNDWEDTNDNPSEDDMITAYRGLTIEQAQSYAQTNNQLFRIVEQDGKSLAVTEDYRPGRINATVYKNIITDISIE